MIYLIDRSATEINICKFFGLSALICFLFGAAHAVAAADGHTQSFFVFVDTVLLTNSHFFLLLRDGVT